LDKDVLERLTYIERWISLRWRRWSSGRTERPI